MAFLSAFLSGVLFPFDTPLAFLALTFRFSSLEKWENSPKNDFVQRMHRWEKLTLQNLCSSLWLLVLLWEHWEDPEYLHIKKHIGLIHRAPNMCVLIMCYTQLCNVHKRTHRTFESAFNATQRNTTQTHTACKPNLIFKQPMQKCNQQLRNKPFLFWWISVEIYSTMKITYCVSLFACFLLLLLFYFQTRVLQQLMDPR